MFTYFSANACFYCALLGADGVGRTPPSTVRTLDNRPVSDGPLLRATHFNGREHVLHAEVKPGST